MQNMILTSALALVACARPTAAADADFQPGAAQDAEVQAVEFDQHHTTFSHVLAHHVHGDRVDYAALLKERDGLDQYTATLEQVPRADFDRWSEDQRFAFWVNAYNAYTLQTVIDHYPVDSIRDIRKGFTGVWDIKFIKLGGLSVTSSKENISLNHIEHEILRKEFSDARVHAAVNCASIGCPPIAGAAFDAEHLDQQLTAQVHAWLADPARTRFDREGGRLELSKIFDWFGEDFKRDAGSVRAWVQRYTTGEDATWLASTDKVKIRHLDYSWKLNDTE
ncbi:MAG: hypothetical protein ACI8Y8_004407 [Planctomycetota bacterium]|jgi:hypothetical protein